MGVFGVRLDIFVICWFMGMGMINYLDASTGIFNYQAAPKYSIESIQNWAGIQVGNESSASTGFNSPDSLPDIVAAAPGLIFNFFTYTLKAGMFIGSVLWNATFGLHTFLRDAFGIPYIPWGLPIMILINLVNFMGLIELWSKIKL